MSEETLSLEEPFVRIDVDQARELVEAGADLVDVREPSEYAEVRIPGARLVPLGTFLARPRDFVQRDNVIFVCAAGIRSALACEMAAAIGLTKVYNLEGGTEAWVAKGLPVARGSLPGGV